MAFLHGVETITVKTGNRTITVVPSSIAVLVGIAPLGAKQTPILVSGSADLPQFGKRLPGFNIPETLDTLFAGRGSVVVVINVFNEDDHVVAVTDEVVAVADARFKLAFAPVGDTAAVLKNAAGDVTYVLDEDYTLDEWGNGVVIAGSSIVAGNIEATYNKLDTTSISDADIIGTIETGDVRTGLQLIDKIPTLFGFRPKIIISPGYTNRAAVSAAIVPFAEKYRAISYIDGETDMSVADALTNRGVLGTIGWNVANSRLIPVYPLWKKSNPDPQAVSGSTILEWYSSLMTAITAAADRELGYHFSPSNKTIPGIVGPELVITTSHTDSTAQNQLLNAAGIVSYLAPVGGGYLSWGNRSSLYPSNTEAVNFIAVQRVKDILEDSVEGAMLPYIDQPLTTGIIDSIRNTVNNFIRTLIQRGALIEGSCTFDPSLNSPEDLAAGQAKFTLTFMSPVPLERITFYSTVDPSLLSTLLAR